MKLTKKLISFLHRVFDKDPAPFLALRLRYAGAGMTWKIEGGQLTTAPVGGIGRPLSVDMTQFTLGQLVNHLAAQSGYTVEYADRSELSLLGAAVLLDAEGDQSLSNGDHLYGYTNVLWSYMEANARELDQAADQIDQMLLQMSTKTASGVWLDELGGYYGVPRLHGELDASYGLRIIAEVLRPRGNNVAIQAAITAYTGQVTKVTDVTVNSPLAPLFNAHDAFNGSSTYNSTSSPMYGLFDVEYGYDIINGGDIAGFAQIIRDLINRLRDAGTHLRALSLTGSILADDVPAPNDDGDLGLSQILVLADMAPVPSDDATVSIAANLADSVPVPVESDSVNYTFTTLYDSLRSYNGVARYASGYTIFDSTLQDETAGTPALT